MLVSLEDPFLKTIDNIFFYINKKKIKNKKIKVVSISINSFLSLVRKALM